MEQVLSIADEKIDVIIANLEQGRKDRPHDYTKEITPYWEHHLSMIQVERVGKGKIRVTGESGFYFPGMTYSGLDRANTLFKRYGLMRTISGTRYDLSIPQRGDVPLGYHVKGKWISSDFLRSIHHARKIDSVLASKHMTLPSVPHILEIGSGTGIQALVFSLLYPSSRYTLVDFPETLALAQVFLSIVFPDSKMLFYDAWSKNPELLLSNEYDFVYVPNYAMSRVPSGSIHLALNTVSMQEMNYDTIGMYFRELRRVLTTPSLFYQSNRDKAMSGTLIEVARYPYVSEDVHLYKGVDEFQKTTIATRGILGRIPCMRNIKIPILRTSIQLPSLTVMAKK